MTHICAPRTSAARLLAAALVPVLASFAFVASGTASASAAETATQASAPTTSSATSAKAAAAPSLSRKVYERRVRKAINARRSDHNLGRLKAGACADGFADRWGKYLANKDKFYHQDMGKVIKGCDAYYAGETLGRGAISPKYLVKLWMKSPAHRQVLLSKHPKRVGVGAFPNSNGEWVVTADFVKS